MAKKRGILDRFLDQVIERAEDIALDVKDAVMDVIEDRVYGWYEGQGMPQNRPVKPPTAAEKRAAKLRKNVKRPNVPQRPPTPEITSYEVLEVSRNASYETISAAYRSLSKKYHPDNKETGNNDRYAAMTAAWQDLKTEERRREYDRQIGLV